MHYYTFHIGDYKAHTEHLSDTEDLAYRRMLDWMYLNESPLPNSPEQIGRLIRMRTHCDSIAVVLEEFFDLDDFGYIQKRAMVEIDKFRAKSKKASASSNARWDKERKKRNANALPTQSEGNANQEPITKNQKPLTKEPKFDFKKSLMSLVNDESLVKDYMDIRRKNKLPNSERAFNGLKNQIDKSHLTYHQAINLCAEKGWKGFKAEWVTNQPVQQTVQHNLNDIASLLNDT